MTIMRGKESTRTTDDPLLNHWSKVVFGVCRVSPLSIVCVYVSSPDETICGRKQTRAEGGERERNSCTVNTALNMTFNGQIRSLGLHRQTCESIADTKVTNRLA
jgi:hypothetical protein